MLGAGVLFGLVVAGGTEFPASCPTRDAFHQMVSAELGWTPPSDHYQLNIEARPRDFVATLQVLDGAPQIFADNDCESLLAAIAVSLAVAMDSRQTIDKSGEKAETHPSLVQESVERAEPWRLQLDLSLGGVAGSGPSPTGALAVRGMAQNGGWGVGLEGQVELPAQLRVGRGTVETQRTALTLLGCGFSEWVWFCGRATLGALRTSSKNLAQSDQPTLLYAGLGGSGGVYFWRSKTWRLAGVLTVEAPLTRAVLQVDDVPVWDAPPVLGSLGLQLAYIFGENE